MKDFIKSVIVLFLITCISGALLGGVYAITEEPRAHQNNSRPLDTKDIDIMVED